MSKKNRIRLFAYEPLEDGCIYTCSSDQSHYLSNVMRQNVGDEIFLFDGQNGEFRAHISKISKKEILLQVSEKVFNFEKVPDIWLLFAPVKKENTDIIVQKAVELGVSKLLPIKTEYTIISQIKKERTLSQIIEAAEQSRRQDIPLLENLKTLEETLSSWDHSRKLIFLDETGEGSCLNEAIYHMEEPIAFLVGPEGGFSKKELEILKKMPYTMGVSLGKRILRSETAAIAALSCWQAFQGDWNKKRKA